MFHNQARKKNGPGAETRRRQKRSGHELFPGFWRFSRSSVAGIRHNALDRRAGSPGEFLGICAHCSSKTLCGLLVPNLRRSLSNKSVTVRLGASALLVRARLCLECSTANAIGNVTKIGKHLSHSSFLRSKSDVMSKSLTSSRLGDAHQGMENRRMAAKPILHVIRIEFSGLLGR